MFFVIFFKWNSCSLCTPLAGIATMYVRYKQVEALGDENDGKLRRLNRCGLALGWLSSFGMCVVANFQVSVAVLGSVLCPLSVLTRRIRQLRPCVRLSEQKTTLFSMHLVGAVLTFGVGALYILVQTVLSYLMQPHVHSKSTYVVRLCIGLWTLASIISSILTSLKAALKM